MISLKEEDTGDNNNNNNSSSSKIEEEPIHHVNTDDLFAPPPGMDDDDEEEDSGTMVMTGDLKKEEAAKQIEKLENQFRREKEMYEKKVKEIKDEIHRIKITAGLKQSI